MLNLGEAFLTQGEVGATDEGRLVEVRSLALEVYIQDIEEVHRQEEASYVEVVACTY